MVSVSSFGEHTSYGIRYTYSYKAQYNPTDIILNPTTISKLLLHMRAGFELCETSCQVCVPD